MARNQEKRRASNRKAQQRWRIKNAAHIAAYKKRHAHRRRIVDRARYAKNAVRLRAKNRKWMQKWRQSSVNRSKQRAINKRYARTVKGRAAHKKAALKYYRKKGKAAAAAYARGYRRRNPDVGRKIAAKAYRKDLNGLRRSWRLRYGISLMRDSKFVAILIARYELKQQFGLVETGK